MAKEVSGATCVPNPMVPRTIRGLASFMWVACTSVRFAFAFMSVMLGVEVRSRSSPPFETFRSCGGVSRGIGRIDGTTHRRLADHGARPGRRGGRTGPARDCRALGRLRFRLLELPHPDRRRRG